ncbi:hypothetical protein DUNSADRAFT_117 [Dunaliella salina]|uniref:Uncharacterized protein n=1 Tax=Dunaliella salina TaxID=3046 RepID=A0ABQ7GYK9_DUNSA|nr:hypothetical protein DUNSADRAFT_117 [Dunaliella salina]|eukprot:KAF5839688.1 hypothetical protein DUNSADRAFT_117 [Dunaliella salina]
MLLCVLPACDLQCQPALRTLVCMLASTQPDVSNGALQALEALTGSFKVCLSSQLAASQRSQLAEVAAVTPLLEAGIVQQLDALLSGKASTGLQNLEQAFGLAATLALNSEAAAQAILQQQEQEHQHQQQQQQKQKHQSPAPGCCGIISEAINLLGDPLAAQLLLQLLKCHSSQRQREAAWVREVAGALFAEQFYFANRNGGVLGGVVLALRLLSPDQAWDIMAEDLGHWISQLASCSASCHGQPHMCDLLGLALTLAKQRPSCGKVLSQAQEELLQHSLPFLTSALQSASSSSSSSRDGSSSGDGLSPLDALLPLCFDALETVAKSGAAQLHRQALRLSCEMLTATTGASLQWHPDQQQQQQQQQQQRLAMTVTCVCAHLQQLLSGSGPWTCQQVAVKFDSGDELLVDCHKRLHAAVLGMQDEGVTHYVAAMRAAALTMAALAGHFAQAGVTVESHAANASKREQSQANRVKHLKDKLAGSQQHVEKLQRELRAFRKDAATARAKGAAGAGSDSEEYLSKKDKEARKDRFKSYKNMKKSAGPYPAH